MKVGETAADWTAAHEEVVVWKFYSACNPQTLVAGLLQGYMGDTQGRGVLQQAAILSISAVVRLDSPPRILAWHDGQFEILSGCWPGVPGGIPTGKDIVTAVESLYR